MELARPEDVTDPAWADHRSLMKRRDLRLGLLITSWPTITLWLMTTMGACASEAPPPDPVPTVGDEQTSVPPTEPAAPSPEPRPTLDAQTACGHALRCCRAFADTLPNVVESTACAGPFEAADAEDADARCTRMQEGWREALLHATGEAPATCGDAPRASGR